MKEPKKLTKTRLTNKALYYLKRFETTEHRLREKLDRDIYKGLSHPDAPDKATLIAWREEIITDCLRRGYVDDARFAESTVTRLARAGKSPSHMRQYLKARGVREEIISTHMAEAEDLPSDVALAWQSLKRKRKWIFRTKGDPADFMEKDKAMLARQGFRFDVIDQVFRYTSDDDFEADDL